MNIFTKLNLFAHGYCSKHLIQKDWVSLMPYGYGCKECRWEHEESKKKRLAKFQEKVEELRNAKEGKQ